MALVKFHITKLSKSMTKIKRERSFFGVNKFVPEEVKEIEPVLFMTWNKSIDGRGCRDR